MSNSINSWYNVSLVDLPEICKWIKTYLSEYQIFLLSGLVGAGKTTFVRFFLESVSQDIVFEGSPTYNYYNIYPVENFTYQLIVHADMYRIEDYDELFIHEFEELQLLNAQFFIENYNPHKGMLLNKHITIFFEELGESRSIRIEKGLGFVYE